MSAWPPTPPAGQWPPATPGPQWRQQPPPYPPPGLHAGQPRPWSGAKVFFAVWGWTILLGTVTGVGLGILAAVVVGVLLSEVPDTGIYEGLAGAGIAFSVIFGVIGGFITGLGSGLFTAATAAATHTRMPPVACGAVSGLVGTVVSALFLILPTGTDSRDAINPLTLLGVSVMFVGLFVVTWLTARRSARAGRGV